MTKTMQEYIDEAKRITAELQALPQYKALEDIYYAFRGNDTDMRRLEEEKLPHADAIREINVKIKAHEEVTNVLKANAQTLLKEVEEVSGYSKMPLAESKATIYLMQPGVTYDVVDIEAVPEKYLKKEVNKIMLNKDIKDGTIDMESAANWLVKRESQRSVVIK